MPKAKQSLDAARAGYVNGRAGFLDVIDAQRTLLEFELTGIEARTQRELALASLSLAIAGVPPCGVGLQGADLLGRESLKQGFRVVAVFLDDVCDVPDFVHERPQ